jgi:hypothetical protein
MLSLRLRLLLLILASPASAAGPDVRLPACTGTVEPIGLRVCWSNTAARGYKTETLKALSKPETYRPEVYGQAVSVLLLDGVRPVTPEGARNWSTLYAYRGELYMRVDPVAEPGVAREVVLRNLEHAARLWSTQTYDVTDTSRRPNTWFKVVYQDGKYALKYDEPPVDWFDARAQPPSPAPDAPAPDPQAPKPWYGPPQSSTGDAVDAVIADEDADDAVDAASQEIDDPR